MATETTNLDIQHIQESQNQKEVTANEAFDILDGALAGQTTVDLAGESGDVTPDADALIRTMVLKTTGAMGGSVNLIVPDNRKLYAVQNNATGGTVTVKTTAGSGVAFSAGNAQFVYCNGTNVEPFATVGSTGAGEATEKTSVFLTGTGGTNDVSIGTNVDPTSVETYVEGIRMRKGSGRDYQVTEAVPASGNYDQLTPGYADAFPSGSNIEIQYYPA